MDGKMSRRSLAILVYGNAFIIGSTLMGFEMLGSRYLFPYFGGGIGTWAGLISTVLCALAFGYFAGGTIVDKHPSPWIMAGAIFLAAAYLMLIPSSADGLMGWIMNTIGDGPDGIMFASCALLLIPLTLLGTFSPVAVRLLLRSTKETGRISGRVYGISTMGNVFGTLFTTFVLIPEIGSRMITYVYACILALCALSFLFASRKES
jgi:hypothetical protein